MTDRRIWRVALTLPLAWALAGPPALAQSDSTVEQAQTPRGKQIASSVERHIAELHRRLRIAPAQEEQWNAYAQITRDNALHADKMYKARSDAENMSALDDLRSVASIAQLHADDLQHLVVAFEALYRVLTPEQQHIADQAFKEFERRGKFPAGRG